MSSYAVLGHQRLRLIIEHMPICPLIGERHVRSIVSADSRDRPGATLYPDRRLGVPARFPRTLFPALTAAPSGGGASALLADHPTLVIMTDFGDLHDVDDRTGLLQSEAILQERAAWA